jgi:hypothetical protein
MNAVRAIARGRGIGPISFEAAGIGRPDTGADALLRFSKP